MTMKQIENYRKRFYSLMESKMGNVKPLVFEQEETDDLLAMANKPLPVKDKPLPVLPKPKIELKPDAEKK